MSNKKKAIRVPGVKQIVNRELIPFTRQISSMLNAGMSIMASISTIEDQCKHPGFKMVLTTLRENIESGSPFSEGLTLFPSVFSDMYVNMVAAGERSGQFADVLKRLALLLDSSARLVRKVKSAMTYPVVILSLAMIMAFGLITFVVPVFKEMFEGFGEQLPFLTQMLVNASNFIRSRWYILIVIAIGAVTSFRYWKSTESGHYQHDAIILKIPIFGELILKVAVARFCRLFAQMLSSGVPILDSMEIVGTSLNNKVIEKTILSARTAVEEGCSLSSALEGSSTLPLLMVRMLSAGEKSGRIDEMLESVADTYDDEVETTLSTLTSLMEPFLMVLLGAIIGTIVIAMFLPIFKLGTIVN
ncbi:MAG: type II secretion system F family protein [Kiritimatiellae bacterium]|jgi:type IV pilus assembly protein PilC|nr:type II secretion system F family protein [Kiritimatiellia bacterium]